jgi:hypothetical protein
MVDTRRVKMLALVAALAPAAAPAQPLPIDAPVTVAGIETVCTGVGLDARTDPRWLDYGLKVEIAGPGGAYLADEQVTIRKDGADLITVSCGAPWLLFRLPPGRYAVEARIGGQTASSAAFVPATGQGRIILRFAEAMP